MSQWLQAWDEAQRPVARVAVLEQALVRQWGAATQLQLTLSGHDRAVLDLALRAAEEPLWVTLVLDDQEVGQRWPLLPQIVDEGTQLRLEAQVTWAGSHALPGTPSAAPLRRRALPLESLDTLVDHFQGLVAWPSLAILALQRAWRSVLPQSCWLQDHESDEVTLRRLLARLPELPRDPAGSAAEALPPLILTGGGLYEQGRWTVGWAAAAPYVEAGDVLTRTLPAPYADLPPCFGRSPTGEPAGRRWRRGVFQPAAWRAEVAAAPPFFAAGRTIARTSDRVQVADHAGQLHWITDLWPLRAGDAIAVAAPAPRLFFGCGTVLRRMDAQWLEVQLADFEPGFDHVPVKLTTPYSGLDTPEVPGEVFPPEPGARVGVVGAGRLGEPLYLLFCDRQAVLPATSHGLWSPRQLQLGAEAIALQAQHDLTCRAGGSSAWLSQEAMRLQGENATLTLAGQRVTTG